MAKEDENMCRSLCCGGQYGKHATEMEAKSHQAEIFWAQETSREKATEVLIKGEGGTASFEPMEPLEIPMGREKRNAFA